MTDLDPRFGGIARLYGDAALARLRRAHVCVIGIGGVGSWSAEALARSGVGELTVVDLDDVCVTNINRQLHALEDTVGRPKVAVLAARLRAINPALRVTPVREFFTAATAEKIFARRFDYVIDAIDNVGNKSRLIAHCRAQHIPLITCGAAGGRRDPTAIRIADLARASHDRLLAQIRKKLRAEHGFPRAPALFEVTAVFSPEAPIGPHDPAADPAAEIVCGTDSPATADTDGDTDSLRRNCNTGLGSATFVTGAFGFAAASHVVTALARDHAR